MGVLSQIRKAAESASIELGARSRAATAPTVGVATVPASSASSSEGGRAGGGSDGSGWPDVAVGPSVARQASPAVVACMVHNDPTHWLETADPNRPGWLRAVCARCGVWIGSRPEEGGSKGKKTQTRRAIE